MYIILLIIVIYIFFKFDKLKNFPGNSFILFSYRNLKYNIIIIFNNKLAHNNIKKGFQ